MKILKKITEKRQSKVNQDEDNVVRVKDIKKKNDEEGKMSTLELIKSKRNTILVFAVVLLVVLFVAYSLLHMTYHGYRVVKHNDTNYENTASYIQFSGNLLKYTPDGVSYINNNGDTVWSAGVDMKMPIAVSSGDYAVVADMSGNAVYVFNKDGQVSSQTMPYTICDVDVSSQGTFAVVLESDKTNYINCYDKSGDIIYEIQTTIDKSGYPLDIAISNDGEKLITSYINIVGNQIQNNIAAYNFGVVGQNANADRIVGGFSFDDQVIPRLEFADNDTIVAFGTKSITIYSMKEKPTPKSTIDYQGELTSVFCTKKYIGYVQNVQQEGTSDPRYKVVVYNLRGNKEFDAHVNFAYDAIYAADKEIIFSGGSRCKIFRKNGSVKFDGTFAGNVLSVTPNGSHLEYVVVYDDATEIIKLKREKAKSSDTSSTEEIDELDYLLGPTDDVSTNTDAQ